MNVLLYFTKAFEINFDNGFEETDLAVGHSDDKI